MSETRRPNALINETSPYLLQHAYNPVQWHPWSETALRKARAEDKPILLSIGYSACHWCHVMEHESFENEAIADLMNRLFVNIKVDREERPDLDAIYMQAIQIMTGSGGWPMTVFLTPDRVPFHGGTYFPPEDRHGMPGFPRVLRSVSQAYVERKADIHEQGAAIVLELKRANRFPGTPGELSGDILDQAADILLVNYDATNGGFGAAPKFPPAMPLEFLMRMFARTGNVRYLEAAEHTLQSMACGGIYDQLGGGFHRYAVDSHWMVPHFEKMLYDNALLSRTYLNAFLITGNVLYRRIVEETLDFVLREMTSPEGGFYSTLDADSEGVEGRFYTWERSEVLLLLGPEHAELFCRYYGITEERSWEGRNILHIPRPGEPVTTLNDAPANQLGDAMAQGKRILFAERGRRIRPVRDEKILIAWNGLMLRSFAEAARGLDRDDYRAAAVRCGEFLLSRCEPDGRLLHVYKDGQARIGAFLDDYACLADGFVSLYEATFEERWLREATRLASTIFEQFQDPDETGFSQTSKGHEALIARPKDYSDNATPSGNSVAAHALLRLGQFTADEAWSRPALSILQALSRLTAHHPAAFGNLLCVLDFALSDVFEIAIVGDPSEKATQALLGEVFHRYLPNKVVACGMDSELALLKNRREVSGRPTAYICRRHVCQAPVTDAKELAKHLQQALPQPHS
jgi:uncharacterized protein YyaL (SSP411 family)